VPVAGQPRDLRLLRGERIACIDGEPACCLAGGEELATHAFGERLGSDTALAGGPNEFAGLRTSVLATEPFPIPGRMGSESGMPCQTHGALIARTTQAAPAVVAEVPLLGVVGRPPNLGPS